MRATIGALIFLLGFLAAPLAARDRALLIGVADYTGKTDFRDLKGPPNDVTAMWSALVKRGIKPEDITVLVNGEIPKAAEFKHHREPTRVNILKALDDLANGGGGGSVVVYYSGHGAFQPNNSNDEDEPETNDQLILPSDIGPYSLTDMTVENAIVDDDLAGKFDAIRKSGSFVWAVFDSCHSGTVTRGPDVTRSMTQADLGLTPEVLERVKAKLKEKGIATSDATRGSGGGRASLLSAKGKAGLVGFYAVDNIYEAIERPFGGYFEGMAGAEPRMGVFTVALHRMLTESKASTYRELAQAVLTEIKSDRSGGPVPAPVFDGGGLDDPLIGGASGTSQVMAKMTDDGIAIPAGIFRGFDEGATVAIYDPKQGEKPIGHAAISPGARAGESEAISIKWVQGVAQPDAGEDVLVEIAVPSITYRFTVAPPVDSNAFVDAAFAEAFGDVTAIGKLGIEVGQKGDPQADAILHLVNGRLYLQYASKPLVTAKDAAADPAKLFSLTPGYDLTGDPKALGGRLREDAWRLAKAAKLLRVAAAAAAGPGESEDDPIKIEAAYYRDPKASLDAKAKCGGKADRTLPRQALAAVGASDLANCDFVEIKISNEVPDGAEDVNYYVGGFYVDALGKVDVLSEKDLSRGCVRKLYSPKFGGKPVTFQFQTVTWNADEDKPSATGEENFVILAIPVTGGDIAPSLCALVQPSISATQQTRGAEATRGSGVPLAALVEGITGSTATRGAGRVSDDEDAPRMAAHVFVFNVQP